MCFTTPEIRTPRTLSSVRIREVPLYYGAIIDEMWPHTGTTSFLVLTNLTEQQAGDYYCRAENERGSDTSLVARLTVLGEGVLGVRVWGVWGVWGRECNILDG